MRQIAIALLIAASPVAASAQSVQSDAQFQIERQGDNTFIRLDRKTGAISTCTIDGQSLDCRPADERAALQDEIDRLANEVDQLKQQIASADGTPKTGIDKSGKEIDAQASERGRDQGRDDLSGRHVPPLVDKVRDLTNDRPDSIECTSTPDSDATVDADIADSVSAAAAQSRSHAGTVLHRHHALVREWLKGDRR